MNRLRGRIALCGLWLLAAACNGTSRDQGAAGAGSALGTQAGASGAAGAGAAGAGQAPSGGVGGSGDGDVGVGGAGGAGGSSGADGGEGGMGTTTGEGQPIELPGDACFGGRTDLSRSSAHCGQCGHACAPFVLASGLDWPIAIELDATTAYWITGGNDAQVMSAPLAGGGAVPLAAAQPFPMDIAVDATHVYWAGYGTIFKVARAGGTPERLVDTQINPHALAVDAQYVYWVDLGDSGNAGAVFKVPLAGGEVVTLASVPGSVPMDIAVDATHVYWANGNNDSNRMVLKVPLAGGEVITVAAGSSQAYGIAVDASAVYWVAHDNVLGFLGASIASVVGKAPLAGGDVITLATGSHMPMAIAVDHASAYWTNASTSYVTSAIPGTDGSVMGVPLAGGDALPVAPNQYEPAGIATNGTHLCWTTTGSGQGGGSVLCLGLCDEGVCE